MFGKLLRLFNLLSLGHIGFMESVWEKVKSELKADIPSNNYMMWIEPLELKGCDNGTVVLGCPNRFSQKWIQGNFRDLLESRINMATGKSYALTLEVAGGNGRVSDKTLLPSAQRPVQKAAKAGKTSSDRQLSLPNMHVRPNTGRMLKKDFTFDNFVVGENNDFAYSAVLSMGMKKKCLNQSLFISARSGMGKSHLTQALGHQVLTVGRCDKIYYITADDFSNEMVHAFSTKTITRFKEKYRNGCDMLLLEDIHSLAGRERTQTELAMVVDYMLDANRKVLFTGECLPGDIPKLNKHLQSRLTAGLITAMEAPDYKTRVRILRKKAKLYGYRIPGEVLEYLADNLAEDVRQLESGLHNVAAKSSLLGIPVDMNLAVDIVNHMAVTRSRITLDAIKKFICKEYGVPEKDLISRSRKQRLAWPRQVGIFLSRRFTDHSLKAIGRCYNRYHATVIHSVNCVESAMKSKPSARQEVNLLSKKIEDGKL